MSWRARELFGRMINKKKINSWTIVSDQKRQCEGSNEYYLSFRCFIF